jgi:hypothetical protein
MNLNMASKSPKKILLMWVFSISSKLDHYTFFVNGFVSVEIIKMAGHNEKKHEMLW